MNLIAGCISKKCIFLKDIELNKIWQIKVPGTKFLPRKITPLFGLGRVAYFI